MSYYNIYPSPRINYMVCSTCSTETFAWLAEVFACFICGSCDYVFPDTSTQHTSEEGIQTERNQEYKDEYRKLGALSVAKGGRKRKRSLSDDGWRV
ncbi:hypothetical protein EJ02DRAFT_342204 [Clathrospora elynae]|uniref:Uncharacterized protein n=1 Tax=Clathrospora elynae TaxID=706981 RepID=A0A6A5STG7_9PLEO|nr:hypothetical protein EJ02DRAFT_342204 [Clathrospora elynae]